MSSEMADPILGKLSGEALLQIIEQLESQTDYQSDDSDSEIITLETEIGGTVDILTDITNLATEAGAASNIETQNGGYTSDTSLGENDDPNDLTYNPDESTESTESDDENETCTLRQTNDFTENVHPAEQANKVNHIDQETYVASTESDDKNETDNRHDRENDNPTEAAEEASNVIDSDQETYSAKHMTGRKRPKRPQCWARNVRKNKRAKGESYVSSRGKNVDAKKIGTACSCKMTCFDKVDIECRRRVFNEFCEIGDSSKQDAYLFSLIHRFPIKRRRPRSDERSGYRNYTYKYYVKASDGTDIEVCGKAFQSIHGIGIGRLRRVKKPATVAPENRQGKYENRQNKIPTSTLAQIREHILSFPRRQSHYSRADNPNKYYLHENLNIRRMWLLYLGKYEPEELLKMRNREKISPQTKYWLYSNIFQNEFNMSFGMPRSDTCCQCDKFEVGINDAVKMDDAEKKTETEHQKEIHLRKAEAAYNELKTFSNKAKTDKDIDAYSFDFQQNLPVPCMTTSDIFYSRQLWTYNFGIHDLTTGDGIMHLWDETKANRGSSEVCSCLEKTILQRHTEAKRLVLFSDGCSGQNKNKAMVAFLSSMCAREDVAYERIDHFFLIRGHTFLPNDRDFGLIEKRKRTESPLIPSDYVKIIEESRTVQPFEVKIMKGTDMKDYKTVADKNVRVKFTTIDGENVGLRSVMWFSYGASEDYDPDLNKDILVHHPDQVWCRYTHNKLESWKKTNVFKRMVDPKNLMANVKYDSSIPLKPGKYNDLKTLMRKGLLSTRVCEFYRKLTVANDSTRATGDESEYEDDYSDT